MMEEISKDCIICHEPLLYLQESEPLTCQLCGTVHESLVKCKRGHFICDTCHSGDAISVIETVCTKTTSPNPMEILELVLRHPKVKLHGPEHHVLVPAAILAAVKNSGHDVPMGFMKQVKERAGKVPGGTCGFWGACGAAVGVGIAIAILTRSTPKKRDERQVSMQATAQALETIADGTEQCCKRASRLAIEVACELLSEEHQIHLECSKQEPCRYASSNPRCSKEECNYYACTG
ncbi:SAM-dependent methyltransferase [Candidatus Bathyarchaeota archaeon]|nr:SAM-dependent methyltransferase [Candidatus Bathyarchaeota archaeon]